MRWRERYVYLRLYRIRHSRRNAISIRKEERLIEAKDSDPIWNLSTSESSACGSHLVLHFQIGIVPSMRDSREDHSEQNVDDVEADRAGDTNLRTLKQTDPESNHSRNEIR